MADTGIVEVASLIERQKFGSFQVKLILLGMAVLILDGFDAQIMGYVAPALSQAWHLPKGVLGPVFAAGLFGLMIGAVICGPLADMFGRRTLILVCTLLFGVMSLLTLTATSLTALEVFRFVTGLALGGAMPNSIALLSEYVRQKHRTGIVTVMSCGFSLGSSLGGFFAAQLIPNFGWASVFWVGGVLPLVLLPFLWFRLPESARFLTLKGGRDAEVAATLVKLNPALAFDAMARFAATEEKSSGGFLVKHLFTEGRAPTTILVWLNYFMHGAALYFVVNWLPTLMNSIGISISEAATANALFQVGGILGALLLGFLIDKKGAFVLATSCVLASILIALMGTVGTSSAAITLFAFLAGALVVGSQNSNNAFTGGTLYPTFIRSTGIGWALGAGRLGGVLAGSLAAGWLLAQNLPLATTFMIGASPEFIAGMALLVLALRRRRVAQQD